MAIGLRIEDGSLRVVLSGRDRLYTLRRSITVPLACVADAHSVERASLDTTGMIRAPGTSLPGRIKAGTFRSTERKEFWDVRYAERVLELLVSLQQELSATLVLVTHDATIASRLDLRVELERGQIQRISRRGPFVNSRRGKL